MNEIYKISSTERIQQVEKELAAQLIELKTEIEGNRGLQETVYCSVPFPKDVEYFRRERELALNKCLQVAEAKPLVIQADVIQRELESCLKREYTSETLPLLLHQFFTDRITQLVQSKYLHMLRWKRFCQHSSVVEQFYSLYQKQVAHIMEEYDDAVQRAVRLSSARENFLTGKTNPGNLITQEDLAIYTQWLICHLHSLKTIHNYLKVLQYLPVSHRMEVGIDRAPPWNDGETFRTLPKMEFLSPNIHFPVCSGTSTTNGTLLRDAFSSLPQHNAETEELKPQLRLLLSQLGISYDVEDLRHSANEMELFSMVTRKFRSIFSEQQTMRTFPVYDVGMPGLEAWGIAGPHMSLKKRANWIPYIKIKAKQDPWQQKLLMKLRQSKKVDGLLLLQAKFLEVSNMEWVMQALQEQATAIPQPKPMTSVSMTSFNSQQYEEIWEKIYCSPEFYQEKQTNGDYDSPAKATDKRVMEDGSLNEGYSFSRKKKDASYTTTLQLLGLDEDTETNSLDLGPRKGAYLSLLYLRHLRIRQLQRICLGILNYFRSIERSLTISTSGLALNAGHLVSTAEDSCWVNAAKGGTGDCSGLGSHSYVHYTPADYKVHSVKFMEFSEIENHDDFYTTEEVYIHTQDQRGVFVMYDVALQDLKKLENQLLLVATQYIEAEKGHKANSDSCNSSRSDWAHTTVDRAAVLLDLWTCEAAFLENKWQLLDSYFEAYQHALDPEERFSLAQVITDIMYRRPRFDFQAGYFLDIYKDECTCLRLHTQLVRDVINQQVDKQRNYNHKIWRDGPKGGISEFGFPPYIISKQLIALNNSLIASKNTYLLEFHPSLGLVSLIPKALGHVLQEFQQISRLKTASEAIKLEKQVLQLALDTWFTMENPESLYGLQIQKDLFTDILVEDPSVVREIVTSALKSVAEEEQKRSKEKQDLILNVFSRLLELLILRHRLIEAAVESAQLGRLYKEFAGEMGFDEFHLYLRPVYFEFATHKEKVDQLPSVFLTSLGEQHDSSVVDRYIPSSIMLNIQDIDNQIGKFSFCTRESILQLLLKPYGMENLQIALACQITHKNTVLVAVQQAAFCPMVQSTQTVGMREGSLSLRSQNSSMGGKSPAGWKEAEDQLMATSRLMSYATGRFVPGQNTLLRLPDAFVSIQLEKQGPRDMMLNTFIQKKRILGSRMQNPEEVEKVRREVIIDYCHRMSHRISQYSLRGQIIAYCNSTKAMLDNFPSVRAQYFIIGLPQEKKGEKEKPENDPRSFQPRPRSLLSSDGQSFLNLWFVPHPSEVLFVFRMLPEKTASRALRQTLQIVAALHDIISYIFSFAQLGNAPCCFDYLCPSEHLTADWGGTEWIGNELQELQKKIDCLQNPSDPAKVAQMLSMHRELLFLQFDAAVRHSMRKMFLSSGNVNAYQSLTDNMYHGLPPLSNAIVGSLFGSQLRLPQPLDPHSHRAEMLFPWRTFLANSGPFSVTIDNLNPINYCMQLCLCGLNDEDRRVAHGELAGMKFIMEDVVWNNHEILSDQRKRQISFRENSETITEARRKALSAPLEPPDPVASCALQRSYLILWKQLEILKAEWGRLKLKVEDINTVPLHKQFSELYGTEVMSPAMKSLARHKGIEDDSERFGTTHLCILPPEEASEVEIKIYQLQKLLESLQIHMIHDVQKKINKEITLVISEKAREERNLPIELWKHHSMQASFSVTRPEVAESFIQRLMENHRETDTEIAFQKDHFEKCLIALGCDIMAREHSNFETYSMFYENILRQQHQLLYQKEQEIHAIEDKGENSELGLSQVAELCHETIMEVTALRARLADLQEEGCSLKEKIRKETQEEYEALVQNIFMVCLQLKGTVDEHRLSMSQRILEIISEVRKEGVDKMINLKKKFGSTKDNSALKEHLEQQEQLQELRNENSQLGQLVCKLKTMSCWKEMAERARLLATVREAEKEAIQNKKECLKSNMISEQEAILFRQQLRAARKALAQTQAENKRLKQQLDKQGHLLQEAEHKMNQEIRQRQQLDLIKTTNLEKMLENLGGRELSLQHMTEAAEKSSKIRQLHEKRVQKEIQQVRSQLAQERSLKQNAFQRVDELQYQLYDLEAAASQRSFPAAGRKRFSHLSHSASSTHNSFSGIPSASQKTGISVATRDFRKHVLTANPLRNSSIKSEKISRPKTVPSGGRKRVIDVLLPDLIRDGTLLCGQKASQK
nr:transmembrane protein FLJ37396 [Pogona vitticeps]